jgi:PAS domain-containing protein
VKFIKGKKNRTNVVRAKVKPKKAKPKPKKPAGPTMVKDAALDATLHLSDYHFAKLVQWYTQAKGDERSGRGYISLPAPEQLEAGAEPQDWTLQWLCLHSYGTAGGVHSSAEDNAWALDEARKAGHPFVNLLWHSHPPGVQGAYWSPTDQAQQAKSLNISASVLPQGDQWFLVYHGLHFLTRRAVWDKRGGPIRFNDGVCRIMGETNLELETSAWDDYGYAQQWRNNWDRGKDGVQVTLYEPDGTQQAHVHKDATPEWDAISEMAFDVEDAYTKADDELLLELALDALRLGLYHSVCYELLNWGVPEVITKLEELDERFRGEI